MMVATVVISLSAGMAFRKKFKFSNSLFLLNNFKPNNTINTYNYWALGFCLTAWVWKDTGTLPVLVLISPVDAFWATDNVL